MKTYLPHVILAKARIQKIKYLKLLQTISFAMLISITLTAKADKVLYDFRNGEYDKLSEQLSPDYDRKDAVFLYNKGLAYVYGYGVGRDLKYGLNTIKKSGELGYLPAQKLIAKYYLLKQKQPENAFKWFQKAAEQDDLESQMFVASAYLFGYGVKRNYDKARKYYIDASKNGNPVAQYTLAEHFLESKHSKDRKLGVLWLQKSADQGNPKALYLLGKLYLEGKLVEQNEILGKELQEKSGLQPPTEDEIKAAEENKKNRWVQLKPEEARKRAVAWIMNDQKPTTSFANFKLDGILWDWNNTFSMQEHSQNQSPKMLPVNSTKIFAYKFETIDPRSIKMSEMLDIIGHLTYKEGKKNFSYPKYPLPKEKDNQEQFEKLEQLAELGYPPAQFKLGQLYQQGVVVEKDLDKALDLYMKSAAQKDMKAEYNIGIMYLKGIGVEKNYNKALEWLEKSAFKGNSYAQFTLGLIYENGIVNKSDGQKIKPDKKHARNLYSLAATGHLPNAQYRLAELNLSGLFNEISSVEDKKTLHQESMELYEAAVKSGITDAELSLAYYYVESKDPKKQEWAHEVASKLAKTENPLAVFLLAIQYDRGIGVDQDREEAIELYQKAVQFDNPIADFILGTYYYNGEVVSKDEQKALRLLKKAASKGQPFAQYNLAVIMHNTDPNSDFIPLLTKAEKQNFIKAKLLLADYQVVHKRDKKNLQQATKIYNQLADKGYQNAQVKLGFMYENGIYFKTDFQKAAHWYELSAKQGNIYAQYFLANMYQVGKLGDPNFEKASYWYQKAAKKEFVPAIIALGFINETMAYNYTEALKWYKQAADKLNSVGLYNLGLMYEYGKGIEVDYSRAFEFYSKASELGYKPAIYNIANLYLNGHGVSKDLDEARELFQKAAKENNNYAQYQLSLIYQNGIGISKDSQKADAYLKQAAENGNVLARLEIKRKKEAEAKAKAAALEKKKAQEAKKEAKAEVKTKKKKS